jgi:hypothetical protein
LVFCPREDFGDCIVPLRRTKSIWLHFFNLSPEPVSNEGEVFIVAGYPVGWQGRATICTCKIEECKHGNVCLKFEYICFLTFEVIILLNLLLIATTKDLMLTSKRNFWQKHVDCSKKLLRGLLKVGRKFEFLASMGLDLYTLPSLLTIRSLLGKHKVSCEVKVNKEN